MSEPWKTADFIHSVSSFPGTLARSGYETVQLPLENQGIVGMIDRTAIYPSAMGMYGGASILPRQMSEGAAYRRPGVALASDMNLPALPPYQVDGNDALSALLAPESASFSEVVVHSWKDWPAGPAYVDSGLGDYLAGRVGEAVYDAVASHGLVEGDLIVQVVVVVQAETGAISQIGRISSN